KPDCSQFNSLVNCNPCNDNYPCFRQSDITNGETVNAVKAVIKTSSDNPILAPTQMLGGTEFSLQESAIGSIVPRCIAFLLDTSKSTVEQTHYTGTGIGQLA